MLTTTQIAQLTAILTGGGMKRSATKEAAAKRFVTVAVEKGSTREDAEEILAASTYAAAENAVGLFVHRIGSGLARLRNAPEAEAIRAAATADAEAAMAAVRATVRPAPLAVKEKIAAFDPHAASNSMIAAFVARGGLDAEDVGIAGKRRAARKAALELGTEPAKASPALKATKNDAPAGTRTKVDGSDKIVAVVENPKKPGSRSHARFACYSEGATVAEFVAACVKAGHEAKEAAADLSWDRRKGFIAIQPAKGE